MTPDSPYLTVDEVAAIVRQTPESIRRWVRQGQLPAIKLPGGQFRFRREDVDRLMGEPATTPPEPVAGGTA